MKSRGLGDTVKKITVKTGIDKVVRAIKKGDCAPCEKRQDFLNKHFPYK
jgi:hypothetical protein